MSDYLNFIIAELLLFKYMIPKSNLNKKYNLKSYLSHQKIEKDYVFYFDTPNVIKIFFPIYVESDLKEYLKWKKQT